MICRTAPKKPKVQPWDTYHAVGACGLRQIPSSLIRTSLCSTKIVASLLLGIGNPCKPLILQIPVYWAEHIVLFIVAVRSELPRVQCSAAVH